MDRRAQEHANEIIDKLNNEITALRSPISKSRRGLPIWAVQYSGFPRRLRELIAKKRKNRARVIIRNIKPNYTATTVQTSPIC